MRKCYIGLYFEIPKELHEKFKSYCKKNGTTMTYLLEEYIKKL